MTQHFHGGHGPTAVHPDPLPADRHTKYKPDVASKRRRTSSCSNKCDVTDSQTSTLSDFKVAES